MLRDCSYTVPLLGCGGAAGPAGRSPPLVGVGSREALGAGAWWEVALEGPGAAPCLCVLSGPTRPLLPSARRLLVGRLRRL